VYFEVHDGGLQPEFPAIKAEICLQIAAGSLTSKLRTEKMRRCLIAAPLRTTFIPGLSLRELTAS